jgi:hypothetical protein
VLKNYRPQENFFGVAFIFYGTKCTKKCMKVVKTAFDGGSHEKKSESA